jgi:hypothetical protein
MILTMMEDGGDNWVVVGVGSDMVSGSVENYSSTHCTVMGG